MKSALNKDVVRDIKKSKGRFLSILLIVALGVAFFSGIKVSPLVMENTSDKYYDDYNFMDIRVLSTLGLSEEDVDKIKEIDGVKGVLPTYAIDALTTYKNQENVLKIHALPLKEIRSNSENYINQVNVIEGRLPNKSGECVIEKNKLDYLDIPIGTTIKLKSGTDEKLSDSLKKTEYKVVGKIETPYYLSYEKGSSNIGSGTVNGVIMVPQEDFKGNIYTDMFLTVKGGKEEDSYSDKYFDLVKKTTDQIERISGNRIEARYEDVKKEANKKLLKGKEELALNKKEINEKLTKAEDDINSGKRQIKDGEIQLKNKEKEVEKQLQNGKKEIENGEKQLEQGKLKYEEGLKVFNEAKTVAQEEINKAQVKLNEVNSQTEMLKQEVLNIENKLQDISISEEEKAILREELSTKQVLLNSVVQALEKGKTELENQKMQLKNKELELASTKLTLDKTSEKLKKEKYNLAIMEAKSKEEFAKAKIEIDKQKINIKNGEEELKTSKEKAIDEIDKAEKKIKDSEDEIAKIEKPTWHILDRNSHYSYAEYAGCATSIDNLAKIFPVFFFSVAALVCLTTMTRMVDEQRINIGTLKALGYSKSKIAQKYIIYALLATLAGSILGLAIGYTVFPIVVFNAYGIMYTLPPVDLIFDVPLALGVTLTSVLITTLSAYSACFNELRETPSILMRPRSPKNGKRILLERIPFIWNKISFIGKVTIRNIFRYKKRFLMTVLGISGCTALILSGLGIQDSIQMIVDGQFGTVFKYDMSVNIDKNIKVSELKKLEKDIALENQITGYEFVNNQNGKVKANDIEKPIEIMVPEDNNEITKFIDLHERKSKKSINLNNNGVVLSEKVARVLNVRVGDNVQLSNSDDKIATVKVIGIAENYVSHYAYMNKEVYKDLFDREPSANKILTKIKDTSKASEQNLQNDLIKMSGVKGVFLNSAAKDDFHNTVKSLNYVVLIMTVSAGALAFVVLYNLTNVNISERIREIATIKVLGFYDNEVSAYIYRENVILTLIGTVIGLGMGVLLHKFIMITVEIESLMFGRVIEFSSYIIAAVLTVTLGIIVNYAMYYKLKTVKMVESLKSVD